MPTTTTTPAEQAATKAMAAKLLAAEQQLTGRERAESAASILATWQQAAEYPASEQGQALTGQAKAKATRQAKAASNLLAEYGEPLLALAEQYNTRTGRKRPESTPALTVAGERQCTHCKHTLPITKFGTTGPVLSEPRTVLGVTYNVGDKVREPYCRQCRTAMRAASKARQAEQQGQGQAPAEQAASTPASGQAEQGQAEQQAASEQAAS